MVRILDCFCFDNRIFVYFSKSTENKAELCRDLHKVFRDPETYQRMVMAHDTTRIVQCMLKRAPADICKEISEVNSNKFVTHFQSFIQIITIFTFSQNEGFSSCG